MSGYIRKRVYMREGIHQWSVGHKNEGDVG